MAPSRTACEQPKTPPPQESPWYILIALSKVLCAYIWLFIKVMRLCSMSQNCSEFIGTHEVFHAIFLHQSERYLIMTSLNI
jgi:hypothetical protein